MPAQVYYYNHEYFRLLLPYEALPVEPVTLPKRKIGKMKQTNFPFRFIPEKF